MSAQSVSGNRYGLGAIVPEGAVLAPDVQLGPYVVLTDLVTVEDGVIIEAGVVFSGLGPGTTVVRSGARVGAGSVIGSGVELGRGSEVRPGAVVLGSVPPNAIVQGNPAQIVGYTQRLVRGDAGLDQSQEAIPPGNKHSVVPLGVGSAKLHRMRRVVDLRGALTVGEVERELPFIPRRYFIVFDVPSRELRGEHAHKECHQFLICVRGSCRILLDDGISRREVTLDRPDLGVHAPPMIWGTQYSYTPDATLLVFASHPYDSSDYIRTYDDFLVAVGKG